MRNSAACPHQIRRRSVLACALAWPALACPTHTSARRAPVPDGLDRQLPRVLAGCGLPLASLGLCVAPVEAGPTVAALNADRPFVMASTAKIVTSLAALQLLGERWRWRTQAIATGPIIDGRLLGDLLIVGGGDPRLSMAELRRWLQELRNGGLRDVRGDLVVDRTAFVLHEGDHAGTPEPGLDRPHHARPDALAIEAGELHVDVQPSLGRLAMISSEPPLDPNRLVNRVVARGGCAAGWHWSDDPGPAQLRMEGQWGPRCGSRRFRVPLPADSGMTAQAVAGLWRDVGGLLGGRPREGDVRAGRTDVFRLPVAGPDGVPRMPLSVHLSPTLAEVVHEINKRSDNVAARHLMLSLSRGFPAQPATLARARERLSLWLDRQGITHGDIEIDNGSGLSRAERARPAALVKLLRAAWADGGQRTFIDSLPVAGVDGTLAHRLQDGPATGQAYLKTGSLRDARALAGYVRSRSGRVHAVALFVNHPSAARATAALDAVIEHLAVHG
jgi:serine-type D-Ala-D-Ala carboxypeptidase/endopeptidase (penicillin-binding protein 4)